MLRCVREPERPTISPEEPSKEAAPNRLLVSYGAQRVEPERSDVSADTTKVDLIDAADEDIRSIDIVYPDILRRVRIEEAEDAVLAVG